ncbi:phage tail assembly chaperone [Erythrobacter sp. W53]|uniref:phage tail assembly chaperone n=1 Tax=Erythrobacter sp. W53 TaxID=3425947 RepID=UPI003D766F76
MSEHFAEAVAEVFGHAAQHLGWTPGTFWQATPAELEMAMRPAGQHNTAPPTREHIMQLIKQDKDNGR